MQKPKTDPLSLDLYEQPGHLIRRAQQIAVSMFHEAVGRDVTPIQYSILRMLQETPGVDQVTLAQQVALDTSTAAEAAARMEAKGWIVRAVRARRQRSLALTPAGEALLATLVPAIHRLQASLLSNLEPVEQRQFMDLLKKFVHLNNDSSRAPLQRGALSDAD